MMHTWRSPDIQGLGHESAGISRSVWFETEQTGLGGCAMASVVGSFGRGAGSGSRSVDHPEKY